MTNDDLPIALRRARRSMPAPAHEPSPAPAPSQTPRKAPKRRVRFSDPGPSSVAAATTPRTTRIVSTGLTPMINRTSLSRGGVGGTPSSSRRRHSMPNAPSGAATDLPPSGEVHFLPLRQVLSGRVQRRIRRNGLSEEMNTITAEKRANAKEAKEQLQLLRDQLRQKDAEIYELQNATIILDTERIWALEKEVDDLRTQLSDRSPAAIASAARQKSCFDWTLAARDPFADDFMETDTVEAESVCGERVQYADETVFGEATMAEMECSTPTRVRSSFLTPPLTSPVAAGPSTPSSHRGKQRVVVSAPSDVGVQADFPDPEKERLEEEVASLRLEMSKLTGTLESYSALTDRLSQKLSSIPPEETASDYSIATIETQITALLRTISDRTAALQDLNTSLCALGFPGSDGAEIVTSLSAALRTARLELEYLTPGEITLPLSSRGAEVLDLLLTRLRDLAKRAKEDEASIDEYHELELSLRQQLGARVAVMGDLEKELKRAKETITEKEGRVGELEFSVERLKGAVAGYVRDITELDGVVGRMESENRDAMATKDAQVEVGRRVLRAKEDVIAKLETKLADAVAQGRSLRKRLTVAEEARTKEVAEVTRRGGAALAGRDARVRELREELERVNAGLRAAHEGIKDLRVEKRGLEGEMVREREAAKGVIEGMMVELERVVGMSREFLGPGAEETGVECAGPGSGVAGGSETGAKRGLLAGDLARRSSGRKRRRYDSGLGFLEEDEVDA
ncbi:hypothetical protein BDP81DRAFT_423961 [Colletotrichum phormii]|uniref:Uncharacterized protein n=1 Tax=Colletotrichum phormii TaxID=359342 RepID=A0AAI9ZTP8_9PEZI|nr:uncharacterized protein BDP81DRAFT_423961 [Colletotrichum phormii]KAK1638029.1 hypothetical protein BDP81DRAFT_423961 [Colletotrichum phormii]